MRQYTIVRSVHKRRPHNIVKNDPLPPCPENVRTGQTYLSTDCKRILWTAPYQTFFSSSFVYSQIYFNNIIIYLAKEETHQWGWQTHSTLQIFNDVIIIYVPVGFFAIRRHFPHYYSVAPDVTGRCEFAIQNRL